MSGAGGGPTPPELLAAARRGDRRAVARSLSLLERGGDLAEEVSRLALPPVEAGHTIGLTGAPGVGKSTLASALVSAIRATGERVAVLAIDPTSPFTGGAILGDRVRMAVHHDDEAVFIRSMATRGDQGGLSSAAAGALRVLRGAGFPRIVLESVGVGQVQLGVEAASDTSVVVLSPGSGDDVQASKAGLMESGDVFVVNKADRPGADLTRRAVEEALHLSPRDGWRPPVVLVQARDEVGVDELLAAVDAHRLHQLAHGGLARRRARQAEAEVEAIVAERVREMAAAALARADLGRDLAALRIDPRSAAAQVLELMGRGASPTPVPAADRGRPDRAPA